MPAQIKRTIILMAVAVASVCVGAWAQKPPDEAARSGTSAGTPPPQSPQPTQTPPPQTTEERKRLIEAAAPGLSQTIDTEDDPLKLWTGGRYRIAPSDVLELHFPYVPEFDQTVTVQPDGYISLSAVGDVRVQGRSVPEAKALLAEAYQGIMQKPVINIVLKEFEKPYFMVAGEVVKPGKIELRGATTLTQGLTLAGGTTSSAKHSNVLLFRRFMTEWLEVKQVDVKKMYASHNMSEDPLLRPGDTVFVPKSTFGKISPFIPRASLGFYLNPF
jgi:polysaccharide export outer membrane protein